MRLTTGEQLREMAKLLPRYEVTTENADVFREEIARLTDVCRHGANRSLAEQEEINELRAELAALKAKAAVPDVNQLIAVLERVRLSDEEAKRHGNGSTYWNNAVLACQIAIRGELAAAPAQPQSAVQEQSE